MFFNFSEEMGKLFSQNKWKNNIDAFNDNNFLAQSPSEAPSL